MKKRQPLFLKGTFTIFYFLFPLFSYSDEGMWPPILLDQFVISDMQQKGCKLSAEDIYSVDHPSMKDAVLLFGSGCTGEVISGQGLVLTNHHCGLGQIQSHSSVDHNYIKNGFWATNNAEELRCPGLTVTFVVRMEDVTEKALGGVNEGMAELERNARIESNSKLIAQDAIKGTRYGAFVRPFYNGNQYYLFITETFRDIRLVGAPPQSIGNFGGDEDNWIWPRHNPDFSLFRIYADSSNQPADYAVSNRPYKPRYFFPISMKGVKEGDFTMVFGFPGKTTEYITSDAVNIIQNVSDPEKVEIRDARLNIWWNDMMSSDTVRIKYTSKYYGLSNAWKKWQGEVRGLKKADVIDKKKEYENLFQQKVEEHPEWQSPYGTLLSQLKTNYDSIKMLQPFIDYYSEALLAPEVYKMITILSPLEDIPSQKNLKVEELQKVIDKMKDQSKGFFKNYDVSADEKIMAAMLQHYLDAEGQKQLPAPVIALLAKYKNNADKLSEELFKSSFLDNENLVIDFLNEYKKGAEKKLIKDPIYQLGINLSEYYNENIVPAYQRLQEKSEILNRMYMKAQMEVFSGKKFYPDANLTLRVAYGTVTGYKPRDGVVYSYSTSDEGVIEKYIPNNEFYDAPQKLIDLFNKKDFGQYADASGELQTCFVASNHTSGGNSGSPVLNAEGQLIGINFDRCWEGTMSDIYFDPDQCRNISADIRYVLFIIDKFAGAGYLMNEMKIMK